ncbi:MAG: tetratricopeptide repeat protein [Synechococcaceae cyanobacterium SM2_3_1]|nr:tetratricopeptide repeat protein [Synechococcaceae cyanobacterium SM2_3_1]
MSCSIEGTHHDPVPGHYREAFFVLERVLQISEAQLGAQHPSTASSLNNLAMLYYSMGRYEAAEPLYVRALAILFDKLEENHPNTRTGLNNYVQMLIEAVKAGHAAALLESGSAPTKQFLTKILSEQQQP